MQDLSHKIKRKMAEKSKSQKLLKAQKWRKKQQEHYNQKLL